MRPNTKWSIFLKPFFCSSVCTSVCVFNVWPKTTCLLPSFAQRCQKVGHPNSQIGTCSPGLCPEIQTWVPTSFLRVLLEAKNRSRLNLPKTELMGLFLHKSVSALVLPICINDSSLQVVQANDLAVTLELLFHSEPTSRPPDGLRHLFTLLSLLGVGSSPRNRFLASTLAACISQGRGRGAQPSPGRHQITDTCGSHQEALRAPADITRS